MSKGVFFDGIKPSRIRPEIHQIDAGQLRSKYIFKKCGTNTYIIYSINTKFEMDN